MKRYAYSWQGQPARTHKLLVRGQHLNSIAGIVEMINEVGALVLFLPLYYPDFNPIEEAFSKLKALIRNGTGDGAP